MKFKLPKGERISPNHTRKISDVLLEFVLEIAPRDSGPKVFDTAVMLAIGLWNLALFPEAEQATGLVRLFDGMKGGKGPMLQLRVQELELQKARYANDRRMVVDYALDYTDKGPHLMVAPLDMDLPANQGRRWRRR
jgi:hypothetical protein